jgi:hypothetical protein
MPRTLSPFPLYIFILRGALAKVQIYFLHLSMHISVHCVKMALVFVLPQNIVLPHRWCS